MRTLGASGEHNLPGNDISLDARPVIFVINALHDPTRLPILEVETPSAITAAKLKNSGWTTIYRYIVQIRERAVGSWWR
jgi:hypothetical protein